VTLSANSNSPSMAATQISSGRHCYRRSFQGELIAQIESKEVGENKMEPEAEQKYPPPVQVERLGSG
jgi:hypothetical protein